MDHIFLTCNSINIQLRASQFMNFCRMFLLPFRNPHMGNPPQVLPFWDVTDLSSVPSGHTLSIETRIYWPLAIEPSFCAWPMGAWLPLVPGSLNDGLSVLLGTLSLTARSSSVALRKSSHGQSSLPDSALHLCLSIRILAQRSWEHKLFVIWSFWGTSIWSSAQYHPVTIRYFPYR